MEGNGVEVGTKKSGGCILVVGGEIKDGGERSKKLAGVVNMCEEKG